MRETTKLGVKYDPAGVIVSSDIIGFAIAFHSRGIPVVLFNDHFLSDKSPGIPPFFSTIIPDGSLLNDLKIEGIWLWWFLRKGFTHFMRKVTTWGAEDGYQKRLARVCGFAYKRYTDFSRTWQYGLKNFPEFFVYPLELDFPHREMRPGYFFAGPMLDLERQEEAFDWSMVEDGSKIVLCSLGTLAHLYYPGYIKFLADIVAIFRKRPGYTVIIAAGESYTQLTGYCSMQHVIIRRTVPQPSILRRAVLMINHAGINSVKECILCGVPMMAYPLSGLNDQRGTAARIVYHGLGKRGNIFRDGRDKIAADLDEVLASPVYRQNAAGMKAVFDRCREQEGEHIDRMATFFHPR